MTRNDILTVCHPFGLLIVWVFLEGCGGSSKPPATPACKLASDCQDKLQCVQGYCVAECNTSKDCPLGSGERCIIATEGNTCQPTEKATCQYTSQCTVPLVCAIDFQCRNQCLQDIDCPTGEKCTSATHVCVDPSIDKNYDSTTNDFIGIDAGVFGDGGTQIGGADGATDAPFLTPDSGSVVFDGGVRSDTGGSSDGRDSGTAGTSGSTCTPGQAPTNFGQPATSDSNPNYTSGVGLLTATEFLTFNAYVGPAATDGGVADGGVAAAVNRIDVQHFDPSTGKSKASATPLLTAAGDGSGLYIDGAAIAPSGEIAIIYSAETGTKWGVYLAFLDKNLSLQQSTQFVPLGLDSTRTNRTCSG